MLGAEDRGLLAALIYWPGFIVGMGAMGINEGIVLQIASRDKSAAIVPTAMTMALGLAIIVSAVCWLLLPHLLGTSRGSYLGEARVYAMVLATTSYVSLCMLAIKQGRLEFNEFNAIRVLQVILYPLLLAYLWTGDFLNVRTAMVSALAGSAIITVILLFRLRRELSCKPNLAESLSIFRKSIRVHVVNILMGLSDQLDKMILVIFATNFQLGQYVVAYTVASAAPSVLVQTFANVILPSAALPDALDNSYPMMNRSLVMIAILVGTAGAMLIALIPLLLPLAFGKGYGDAIPYAQVLTLALAASGVAKCFVYALRSRQVTRPALWSQATISGFMLIGGYAAFHRFGVMGLCWAIVFSYVAGLAVICRKYWFVVSEPRRQGA